MPSVATKPLLDLCIEGQKALGQVLAARLQLRNVLEVLGRNHHDDLDSFTFANVVYTTATQLHGDLIADFDKFQLGNASVEEYDDFFRMALGFLDNEQKRVRDGA